MKLAFNTRGYGRQTIQQPNGRQVEIEVTPDLIIEVLMPDPDKEAELVQIWSRQAAVRGNDSFEVYVRPREIPSLIQSLRDAAEFWGILPSSGDESDARAALLSSPIKTWLSDGLSVVAFPSGYAVAAYAHNLKAQKARMLVLNSIEATTGNAGVCILPSEILPLIDVLGEAKGILEGDECLHTDT
jgi:hypothetical protein